MPASTQVTSAPQPAQVKGALLNEMLRVMAKDVGPAQHAHLVAQFDVALRDLITSKGILNGSWYSVEYANAVMLAAYAPGKNAAENSRRSGIDVVTNLLGSIHRFLIQNMSSSAAIKHANLLFRNYYRGGVMQGVVTSEGVGHIKATGYHGMGRELWQAICGGTETIVMATGAKNVSATLKSHSAADGEALIDVVWQ